LRGHRQTGFESPDELLRPLTSVHHCAQYPDHFEDLSDAPLIERMDGEPASTLRRSTVAVTSLPLCSRAGSITPTISASTRRPAGDIKGEALG
jgi:hypothetical protein